MVNQKKIARMAKAAFENGLRLHYDSITLYRSGSFPGAYQMSVLAQEEIGKAFILEEITFRRHSDELDDDGEKEMLSQLILNHHVKQGWFIRQTGDMFQRRRGQLTLNRFAREAYDGTLNSRKMNATYVGLTRSGKRINLKGKIIEPNKLSSATARRQITYVSDFVLHLAEGCMRGVMMVNTPEVDGLFAPELVVELERAWPDKSRAMQQRLIRIRRYPIVPYDER